MTADIRRKGSLLSVNLIGDRHELIKWIRKHCEISEGHDDDGQPAHLVTIDVERLKQMLKMLGRPGMIASPTSLSRKEVQAIDPGEIREVHVHVNSKTNHLPYGITIA